MAILQFQSLSSLSTLPIHLPRAKRTPLFNNPIFRITLKPSPPPAPPPSTLILPPPAAISPQNYVYPDPILEFAQFETKKFRTQLMKKLFKDKETFGDDLDAVVDFCSEIFSDFLHKEYGGPGTLLVEPFTDMLIALKEKKLPGAPLAARAALLWAQNHVDHDWDIWNSDIPN